MDTAAKAEEVSEKATNVKKDMVTPEGAYRVEEAKKVRARRKQNKIVEKWYELRGRKLCLCRKSNIGTVQRLFEGSLDDPKNGDKIRDFVVKLEKEGRLKHRV